MPDEMLQEGVYDKKRDLVGGGGNKNVPKNSKGGILWVFYLLLIISVLIYLLCMIAAGWSFLLLPLIILFIIHLIFIFRYKNGFLGIFGVIFISIFIYVLYFFTLGFAAPAAPSLENDMKGQAVDGSKADCTEMSERYDKKIFTISSPQKYKGSIGVVIDKETCKYTFTWHEIYTSSKIKKNKPNASMPLLHYDYYEDVVFQREGNRPMDGQINPVYQNKEVLPSDAFMLRAPFELHNTKEIINNTAKDAFTDTFFHTFEQSGAISKTTLDDLFAVKKVRIFGTEDNKSPVIEEFDVEIKAP